MGNLGNREWGIEDEDEVKLNKSDPFDYLGQALKASVGKGNKGKPLKGYNVQMLIKRPIRYYECVQKE
jgi:hypothetical protein